MTREEAINILKQYKRLAYELYRYEQEDLNAFDMAIEALQAEAVKVAYICDGRKCDSDCSECFRTLDVEHAKNFIRLGDAYMEQPSADAVEVVRCKDCIHYKSDGGALMVCRIDDMVVDDTDYCSYGEKVIP